MEVTFQGKANAGRMRFYPQESGDRMRFTRCARMVALFGVGCMALFWNAAPLFAMEPGQVGASGRCTYFMCEYEQSNIDTVILAHAQTSQTVMFGEIHDNALEGMPAPVQDSIFVITLLGPLKRIGYDYLALEVNPDAPAGTHSYDVVRFCRSYKKGRDLDEEPFPHAKPGWIELAGRAIDLGYQIRFIDAAQQVGFGSLPRDKAMFDRIKREIFDDDADARVVVYIGAFHVGELETETGIFISRGRKKPLGFFLSQYTHGKNFSVYMGNTHDTPVGCDLFISHFIWDGGRSGYEAPPLSTR